MNTINHPWVACSISIQSSPYLSEKQLLFHTNSTKRSFFQIFAVFSLSENAGNRVDCIILVDDLARDFGMNTLKNMLKYALLMMYVKQKVEETHENVSSS